MSNSAESRNLRSIFSVPNATRLIQVAKALAFSLC